MSPINNRARTTPALILASASPQRSRLLKKLRRPFRVIPSRVSESCRERNPRRLVIRLALRKAVDISRRHPDRVVLGADTIVTCRGKILLKPRGLKDSKRILKTLNGRWQKVYTGIALSFDGGRTTMVRAVMSRVLARRLPPERLRTLVGKHMDKAGSYAVQDSKDPFIALVEGDIDNVVGLPVKDLRLLLKKFAQRLRAPRRGAGANRLLSRR